MNSAFTELMREAMAGEDRFGHRQHVRLTWLAVRRYGTAAAVDLVSEGIRRTAAGAGAPEKFHMTMSRAWVELVGHHAVDDDDFETFAARHPELLDKELLGRFYRPGTLAADAARAGWVEPDLAPFPREFPISGATGHHRPAAGN
ncbi:hypothetical protein ACIHFE_25930 [Streptomyces sp. NPDC052396]|uniref:hypothetical protein n=1 Tax=Streptomyces sp. NPDC052396 TaxID=3365689 RepID=UPI0037D59B30